MYNINLNAYLINVIINLFWKQPLARGSDHCVQKLAHPQEKEEEEDNSGLLKDQSTNLSKHDAWVGPNYGHQSLSIKEYGVTAHSC